jgi:uncharacterized protein (UPF0147 family)
MSDSYLNKLDKEIEFLRVIQKDDFFSTNVRVSALEAETALLKFKVSLIEMVAQNENKI